MQLPWLLHSSMYSFFSRRETVNQLKMPQSCILRCSVQPVHLLAKMAKRANNLFSKSKSETESSKCTHFWLSFPIYQFYVCYQSHCLIQLLQEVDSTEEEKIKKKRKKKKNSPLLPVLSVSDAPNSQKLTAYMLFHLLLPRYDGIISSFISFFVHNEKKLLHS